MPNAALSALVDTHADLLARAQEAARTREYWSAFPESPSPRVYGEHAAAEGESAFQALLGSTLDLGQPDDGTTVGQELSPYGFELGVRYPHASSDALIDAARAALPAWQAATPRERAAVGAEILTRINARSFEMAHAVMHTSGQAFVMAFQAGGPHAQDRGLEAVAYALAEQERHAPSVLWEKPQGKRPPLRMVKTFTPVSRGVALVIGCNTFPTWNSYPGLFASLVTGNSVIVKPHPRGVLPLALSVSIAREVLAETGFDPNVVTLAVEAQDERIAADLATDPRVAIVDFTGSTDFGEWLEDNARQALVYTEKAGVNSVILESTDDYRGAMANLAFTLSLYTGQMCTTTQNIYVPRGGVRTEDGMRTPAQVAEDLGAALDRLLGDDEKAAGILGAIVNDDVAARLDKASGGPVAVASRQVKVEAWPDARIRTPLVLHATAEDRSSYSGECFGPISYLVETESRDQAVEIFEEITRDIGALSAGVYSTDEAFLEQVRAVSLRAGVALSENLTGGVFVNQTAAFSDFHATGANPSANAAYTDGHFVAGRFRIITVRRHAPAEKPAS
uniref:Phenylacetic acid degradation protein PaaN2, ring-opening aldehyde dehydrogenase n=1 Tax=uncultured Nocardioidaceae bacterium TaxID=253824 RepID=A0A6J4MMW8_9ACTN|nr:MAG: Phenylacetic acid degradation protein PaaN2, ring-opening aldehyde dehydrogenase [uncultured Nocardioidaceae bacterium]